MGQPRTKERHAYFLINSSSFETFGPGPSGFKSWQRDELIKVDIALFCYRAPDGFQFTLRRGQFLLRQVIGHFQEAGAVFFRYRSPSRNFAGELNHICNWPCASSMFLASPDMTELVGSRIFARPLKIARSPCALSLAAPTLTF